MPGQIGRSSSGTKKLTVSAPDNPRSGGHSRIWWPMQKRPCPLRKYLQPLLKRTLGTGPVQKMLRYGQAGMGKRCSFKYLALKPFRSLDHGHCISTSINKEIQPKNTITTFVYLAGSRVSLETNVLSVLSWDIKTAYIHCENSSYSSGIAMKTSHVTHCAHGLINLFTHAVRAPQFRNTGVEGRRGCQAILLKVYTLHSS